MPNIDTLLGNIMEAKYGEAVRGSIHDAIEAINEVVENWEDGQMDDTFTSTTLPASAKAVGDAVADLKSALDFTREKTGINLYNWETTKKYVLLNSSTGEEEYSANNDSSDFIPFDGTKVSLRDFKQFNINTLYRVYFYTSNKTFIERQTTTTALTAVFTVPENTAYIRISETHKDTVSKLMIVNGETTLTVYKPYYTSIDYTARKGVSDNATDIANNTEQIEENTMQISDAVVKSGKNLYNKYTTKKYVLLNSSTGEEEYSANNDSSDFIPFDGDKVSLRDFDQFNINTLYRVYFYTSNKTFIERQTTTTALTAVFTVPENTAYIRISETHESGYSKLMIAGGEVTLKKYESYYTAKDNVARERSEENVETINLINQELTDICEPTGQNLYNKYTTKKYVLLNSSTGAEEYSANNDSSDFIPISEEKVSLRAFDQLGISTLYRVYFYESDKSFIERQTTTTADTAVFTVPENTAYIRISETHKSGYSKLMIAGGEKTLKRYVSYYTAIDIIARIETPPPMLTIIDDDGHKDYMDYLLPFCKSYNVPISTAVTPLRFGGQSGVGRYMTLEEIKTCMNNGAEVLCHSYTHEPESRDIRRTAIVNGTYVNSTTFNDAYGNPVTPATDITYYDTISGKYYIYTGSGFWHIENATIPDYEKLIEVYTDVTGYYDSNNQACYESKESYYTDKLAKYYNIAKSILLQNGLTDSNILVYNNDTGDDEMCQRAAQRVFRCGFDINGSQLNMFGNIKRSQVHRYSIENAVNQYYGVARMKQLIDIAVANGGWMVWTMHTTGAEWRGTTSGGHTGIGREAVLDHLAQAINYAHNKGLQIVTAAYGCSAYIDGVA